MLEPLANFGPDGALVPVLATEIPSPENGGISEDLTSITWNLRDDVVWSDGSPFTSEDVVFTYEYCTHPEGGCVQSDEFEGIVSVEAMGPHQVTITFDSPKPYPFLPLVAQTTPILQKAQFGECLGAEMAACTEANFAPIGTGPFMVEEFRPNDVVTYVRNPNFRDADMGKPFFDRVVFKGGGDAESPRALFWKPAKPITPGTCRFPLRSWTRWKRPATAQIAVAFGQSTETLWINPTDVSPDNPNRSVWMADGSNAHPFLTNKTDYPSYVHGD